MTGHQNTLLSRRGKKKNSQGFNRYSYVKNNPLTSIDPLGFEEESASASDIDYIDAPPDLSDIESVVVTGTRNSPPPPPPPGFSPTPAGASYGGGDTGHGSEPTGLPADSIVHVVAARAHGILQLVGPLPMASDESSNKRQDCVNKCMEKAQTHIKAAAAFTAATASASEAGPLALLVGAFAAGGSYLSDALQNKGPAADWASSGSDAAIGAESSMLSGQKLNGGVAGGLAGGLISGVAQDLGAPDLLSGSLGSAADDVANELANGKIGSLASGVLKAAKGGFVYAGAFLAATAAAEGICNFSCSH